MLKRLLTGKVLLFLIVLLAIFFRFYGLNWDQGQHLHPDERFLTLVGVAMKMPPTLSDYLTPQTSSFNPANIGYSFYVYGTFPVVVNKLLAINLNLDTYADFTILGRLLSAFVDLFVVVLVFKLVALLEKRHKLRSNVKYWAAFFYAIAVLPIQLSHFFAVDTFLNLFVFTSFYFAIRYSILKKLRWLILGGLFFGLAISTKATAVFIVPLILYGILAAHYKKAFKLKPFMIIVGRDLLLFGLITYVVMRFADPYLFESGNFFDPTISHLFLENLKQLNYWSNPTAWYPPGVQWLHKLPVLFALQNLVVFGLGIGASLFALIGGYVIAKKYRKTEIFLFLVWGILFFLYQSFQMSKTMRYFLLLYPFLAIFAGIGFAYVTTSLNRYAKVLAVLFVLIWPLLFFSIYTKPHSRITASEWIYNTVPNNSILLSEHWDDALPLILPQTSPKIFTIQELKVFDPDSAQKWQEMDTLLAQGDYLILSSNRGWGSIPTVPERYPRMKVFYEDLLAGKTDYQKVAEFTSYPSLRYLGLPIEFPDDWAEEAFTVYDHPKVMIFKHER